MTVRWCQVEWLGLQEAKRNGWQAWNARHPPASSPPPSACHLKQPLQSMLWVSWPCLLNQLSPLFLKISELLLRDLISIEIPG